MPLPFRLKRVKPREPVSASSYNELLQAVEDLARSIREPDGQLTAAIAAKVLAGREGNLVIWGRISAVNVGTPNANSISGRPAYTPSDVTYDVEGISRPGISLSAATPHYGRPTRYDDALIHPARVKDLCYIETFFDQALEEQVSRLGLLPGSEVIANRVCPPKAPS